MKQAACFIKEKYVLSGKRLHCFKGNRGTGLVEIFNNERKVHSNVFSYGIAESALFGFESKTVFKKMRNHQFMLFIYTKSNSKKQIIC